jgi:AcrR family transcriptional regulator
MKAKRWTRRKHARAPEILEAALACFAEKGFAATRMADIAARAHISKGTIYLYFDSKEAVFKALARRSIGAQIAAVSEQVSASDAPAPDKLRFVIGTIGYFVRTSDRVVLPRVLLAEAGQFPELLEFWRREIVDRGLGLFSAIIARGVERGELREVDPGHAARLCIAPLLMTALWRSLFERTGAATYDHAGLVETHLATLIRGLEPEEAR